MAALGHTTKASGTGTRSMNQERMLSRYLELRDTVKEATEEAGISPQQYREHRKWWRLVFTEPLEACEGRAA